MSAEEGIAAILSRVPWNIKDTGWGRWHDKYQEEERRKAQNTLRKAGDLSKFRSAHFEIQVNHFTAWTNSFDADKNWFVTAEETLGWICQVPLRSDCRCRIVYSSGSVGLTQKLNRTRLYIYVTYQLFEQWDILHQVLHYLKTADKYKMFLISPANF